MQTSAQINRDAMPEAHPELYRPYQGPEPLDETHHFDQQSSDLAENLESMQRFRHSDRFYPFMNVDTLETVWPKIVRILPTRQEILSFFHFYREIASQFVAMVTNIHGLDLIVSTHLERIAGGLAECKMDEDKPENDVARIGLLLATLASGVQFSDRPGHERMSLSQDFGP